MSPPVDLARYIAYVGVTVVIVATPGPAILFAIATGARRGHQAVIPAMIGMNLASVIWLSAAGLGLSALALAFPAVFRVLAWLGAAYVAWLGLKAVMSAFHDDAEAGRHLVRWAFCKQPEVIEDGLARLAAADLHR